MLLAADALPLFCAVSACLLTGRNRKTGRKRPCCKDFQCSGMQNNFLRKKLPGRVSTGVALPLRLATPRRVAILNAVHVRRKAVASTRVEPVFRRKQNVLTPSRFTSPTLCQKRLTSTVLPFLLAASNLMT